ncbi:Metallothionein expression activator-like protein [Emericellopsis cladophorae]|uniref:Metallothionein expression activator-like protein n=1 Tax=Emericellopsis cladophorae TaxID=2686198 RepID=A0A9P9Y4A7_9HYPO|nr:Metallothionein expression activator-like protein [Emericellopsis cladophorae]KAI6783206.1 Metallothionein expression activator-like protein [Emericellopsis cladophorae]
MFPRYPEPPHSASSGSNSPMYTMPPANTTAAFEPFLYASMYEDSEIRMPGSSLSTASASSSNAGSPIHNDWRHLPSHTMGMAQPSIVGNDYGEYMDVGHNGYAGAQMEDMQLFDYTQATKGFVDPAMIQPTDSGAPLAPHYQPHPHHQYHTHSYHPHHPQHQQPHSAYPVSPSLSGSSPMARNSSASPSLLQSTVPFHQAPFAHSPYATSTVDPLARRPSMASFVSPTAENSGDEAKEKQRCTYSDCGKVFKDIKAHMLTHQTERPEKCPIQTCEYHSKGFARKYDKNRHTLTHYKGTMVCGFCPGSGSPAEKSFNRADVFKRHLTAVHGVEQTPPNSRKKTPVGNNSGKKLTGYAADATGKCSTCSSTFSNAQDFYEHLDDCVLRIVQQEDPAEAVNAQLLGEVLNDKDVLKTLAKNKVSDASDPMHEDGESEQDGEGELDTDAQTAEDDAKVFGEHRSDAGVRKSRGLTHSRGGVPAKVKSKDRKPKRYPTSWGDNSARAQNMKKRVMACFDGPRRLVKDDMLLSVEHEVRLKLADGKHYVTDLDMQTLKRAEGFLGATDEERGPWIADDPTDEQIEQMLKL